MIGEIFRLATPQISSDNLKLCRSIEIRIIIERPQPVREVIVQQLDIEDITRGKQETQPQILVAATLYKADVRETRPTLLPCDIAAAVACTCRDTYDIGKTQASLHKGIEHANGEYATHASSFKHQPSFIDVIHLKLCKNYINTMQSYKNVR